MEPERIRGRWAARLRFARIAAIVFLVFLADGIWHSAPPWEYGLLNDFHFSVREELSDDREFQIDNYYSMDVYRIGGKVDFHSAFLVTNDLNLLDRAAAQLTLAYLSADRLSGRFNVRAGRQFFTKAMDAFIADGLYVEYLTSPFLTVSMHVAVPFNAESQAIEDEPMIVYGFGLETRGGKRGSSTPFTLGASVERRVRTDVDGLDQTLVGLRGSAELQGPIESDVYAHLEYELEDTRVRGVRFGSLLYLAPMLVCRLEGQRYGPDQRKLKEQVDQFLSDAIVNYFSASEVWGGRAALTYSLRNGREVTLSYAGYWHDRRSGQGGAFGQGVDLFFTLLSVPSLRAVGGAGYSAQLFEDDSMHLGVVRGSVFPLPQLETGLLAEAGILDTSSWDDEFVLHIRGQMLYSPRPNLRITLALEENRNPYFNSDLRGMVFVRYFWEGRVP